MIRALRLIHASQSQIECGQDGDLADAIANRYQVWERAGPNRAEHFCAMRCARPPPTGRTRSTVDIYKVPMGSDFPEHVRRIWSQTQILLVLIGANWLRRADPLSPRVALRYVAVPAFALLVAHYLIVNAFDLHVICASPVLSSPCRSGLRSSGKHERDRLPPLPSARSLAWLRPAR